MKTSTVLVAALLVAGGLRASAHATEAGCTIADAVSVNNLNLPFPIPVAAGLVMAVEFDEAAGTFSMSRDAWSNAFGPSGAAFDVGFGDVQGFLIMGPGMVSGSMDSAGNVVLPHFDMAFATTFCLPRSPDYPIAPDLVAGTHFSFASGAAFAQQGSRIDSNGNLTVEGVDVLSGACGAPGDILSGLRITCQLSPAPDVTKAPAPPALAKVAGKAKIGKPLPAEPPKKAPKGDLLSLKSELVAWPAEANVMTEDSYIRIADSDGSIVLLRVPAGKFTAKGRKLTVTDTDGKSIEVLVGHKKSGDVSAAFRGRITVASGKGTRLTLKMLGLDLGGLSQSATVTAAVGPYSASADVTVRGSGKVRSFR